MICAHCRRPLRRPAAMVGKLAFGPVCARRLGLLTPPGIIGDIARHIITTAQRQQPVLAVTAALSLAGTVLGRKKTATGWRCAGCHQSREYRRAIKEAA